MTGKTEDQRQTMIDAPEVAIDMSWPVEQSLQILRDFEPDDGYFGCFSGGKDSIVLKHLAMLAHVKVEWHYHMTTIDPPELIHFMKKNHPDVIWDKPKTPFFQRMEKKGFPTRIVRWCCEEFKESRAPRGARLLLGVRAAESPRRAATWQVVTAHRRTGDFAIAPILYWQDAHVWKYIRENKMAYCTLYDEGFKRLGCIGCPMAREAGRRKEFARWPGYERLWKRAFQRIYDKRKGSIQRNGKPWFGSYFFDTWQDMWEWWISDAPLPPRDYEPEPGDLFYRDPDPEEKCIGVPGMFSE